MRNIAIIAGLILILALAAACTGNEPTAEPPAIVLAPSAAPPATADLEDESTPMERTATIKPMGDVAMEQDIGTEQDVAMGRTAGLNCDGVFRNQLTFQRGASTADRMNVLVSQIQSNHRSDCNSEAWNPVVIDLDNTTGNPAEKCSGATAQARKTSGRDSENNILNQYQGGMSISGVLKTISRTPRRLTSPLRPNWGRPAVRSGDMHISPWLQFSLLLRHLVRSPIRRSKLLALLRSSQAVA